MDLPSDKELREFQRWGVEPPKHTSHGLTMEEIRERLVQAEVTSWTLSGNELIAETNFGTLVQTIPPNYICLGKDKNNLPILKKIGITEDSAADRGAK